MAAKYHVVLKDPDRRMRDDLRPHVKRELAKLAPLVASSLAAKQRSDFIDSVQALVCGVELGTIDIERAQLRRADARMTRRCPLTPNRVLQRPRAFLLFGDRFSVNR